MAVYFKPAMYDVMAYGGRAGKFFWVLNFPLALKALPSKSIQVRGLRNSTLLVRHLPARALPYPLAGRFEIQAAGPQMLATVKT